MSRTATDDGVPEFAVVGRVNMGKSSVIATLLEIDDNEVLRVSPTPGETTQVQVHRVIFGKKECVRFLDTPGFSRPVEAMREIQEIHGEGVPGREAIRAFCEKEGSDFEDEKRLLRPLVGGCGGDVCGGSCEADEGRFFGRDGNSAVDGEAALSDFK